MSFNSTSIANLSDSDDESYEAGLARRRAEAETLLRQQEEKERFERQARKEEWQNGKDWRKRYKKNRKRKRHGGEKKTAREIWPNI